MTHEAVIGLIIYTLGILWFLKMFVISATPYKEETKPELWFHYALLVISILLWPLTLVILVILLLLGRGQE